MHTYAFSRRMDSGENEGQEVICAFHNAEGTESTTMSIRAESTITPGTTLVNVMDSNDRITVTSDRKIKISLTGNNSKIYVVDEEAEAKVPVTFTINNATTTWGQNVYIVGNCAELGNWDTDAAVGPAVCPDYPTWTVTAYFTPGTAIEFKAIKKDDSGNVTWQEGNNHSYTVPASGEGQITVNW